MFLVVLFHTEVPGFLGGFVGVDLFFVLSGYLITAGLVRNLSGGRGAGLGRFWARRFLRLLPAALLVVVTILVWSLGWAPAYRRPGLGADLFATVLYVANWHFIDSSGYFANEGVASPLLHMWSLAVEEQFYLAWPLVLAGGWRLLRRRGTAFARAGVALVAGALVLASAVLLTALARHGLTDRAYMGSDAKAFEPLLGALVALGASVPGATERVRRIATPLGWVGAVALVVLVPLLGGEHGPTGFYFCGGAVAFSLAGAAVIVTLALGWVRGLSDILALAPVAYLGRISYGIYLWHWPLTCWLLGRRGWDPTVTAEVVVGSVLLASASYHLVEMPIRRGRSRLWSTTKRTLTASGVVVATLAVAAAALGGTPLSGVVNRYVTPPGGAGRDVVLVIGDSVPQRLLAELSDAASARGLTLVSATAGGCSPLGVDRRIAPGDVTGRQCAAQVPGKIRTAVQTYHPGVIVWWSRYELADRLDDGRLLAAGHEDFWAAQQRDLRVRLGELTADGSHVVLVETDRPGVGLDSRCTPRDCHPFLRRLRDDDALRVRWNQILRDQRSARVSTVPIDDVYCHDARTPCDDRDALGVPVRADGSHFSDEAMKRRVADVLLDRVREAVGHRR